MTRIRQRQRGHAPYGELDQIVVQLFDDLAKEEHSLQSIRPAATRSGPGLRKLRRENERFPADAVGGMALDHHTNIQVAEQGPLETQSSGKASPDEAGEDSVLSPNETEYLDAKSLSAEEAKFVEHVVTWMTPRPNADLLLRAMQTSLRQAKRASQRQKADGKQGSGGSAKSAPVVEGKPASSEKRA